MSASRPYLVGLQQMTARLEETENKREKVLVYMNEAPFVCFMKSVETGKYEFMNRAGLEQFEMTDQQVIGKTDIDLFPPDIAKEMIANDVTVLRTRKPVMALEKRTFNKKVSLYLVSKFIVKNGEESIGGIAIEVPDKFRLEPLD